MNAPPKPPKSTMSKEERVAIIGGCFALLVAVITGVFTYASGHNSLPSATATPTLSAPSLSAVASSSPASSPSSMQPTRTSTTGPKTYPEQEGSLGADTFPNPYNLSGTGPNKIAPGQWVQVTCKVYAPTIQSVTPDGYWYLIASSPWNNAYYAAANTFLNGDPWGGPYTHNTDFKVPDC